MKAQRGGVRTKLDSCKSQESSFFVTATYTEEKEVAPIGSHATASSGYQNLRSEFDLKLAEEEPKN
jgi:hypothetical protein